MFDKLYQRWRRLIRRRIWRRPLLPFLLAATVAVGCVVAVTFEVVDYPYELWGQVRSYASIGFLLGVQGLAAIWLVSARRGWAPRLLVAGAVVAIAAGILREADAEAFAGWATFLGVALALQSLFVLLAKGVIRRWRPRRGLARVGLRFSMAGAIALMTAVAVVAALSRSATNMFLISAEPLIFLAAESALPAILLAIVMLCKRSWMTVLVTLLFVAPVYLLILPLVDSGGSVLVTLVAVWIPYLLAQVTVILAWLLGLRIRRRPVDKPPAAIALPETAAVAIADPPTTEPQSSLDLEG